MSRTVSSEISRELDLGNDVAAYAIADATGFQVFGLCSGGATVTYLTGEFHVLAQVLCSGSFCQTLEQVCEGGRASE